ncbi:MAG: hypothetical protein IKM58_03525 [Tidjanibacter sp.]|nr:hypothetical protein [Tidjanibacter sp.]
MNKPLVAFFASRSALSHAAELSREWAHAICETDKVVISGFQSPIEREVLDILLSRNHPVIVALGRSLYLRMPDVYRLAYSENRLLFISFRNHTRHNLSNAQIRNWAVADMADEVVFAPFAPESQLSSLHHMLSFRDDAICVLGA